MDFLNVDICQIEETIEEKQLDNGFDIIIDKAVLDCVACNEDSTLIQKAVENIWRMLENGGTYFLVSRSPPAMRMHLFEDPSSHQN